MSSAGCPASCGPWWLARSRRAQWLRYHGPFRPCRVRPVPHEPYASRSTPMVGAGDGDARAVQLPGSDGGSSHCLLQRADPRREHSCSVCWAWVCAEPVPLDAGPRMWCGPRPTCWPWCCSTIAGPPAEQSRATGDAIAPDPSPARRDLRAGRSRGQQRADRGGVWASAPAPSRSISRRPIASSA